MTGGDRANCLNCGERSAKCVWLSDYYDQVCCGGCDHPPARRYPCCEHCPGTFRPEGHRRPCPRCHPAPAAPMGEPPVTGGDRDDLANFTIVYEPTSAGTLAVLIRKGDGKPMLALSAGTTLDRILAAAVPDRAAPTEETPWPSSAGFEDTAGARLAPTTSPGESAIGAVSYVEADPATPTEGAGECPEREYHGKPFRYCPVKGCGWGEPSSEDADPLLRLTEAVTDPETYWQDRADRAETERDALRDRILALHRRGLLNPDSAGSPWVCKRDGEHWPCDTARAALVPPSPGEPDTVTADDLAASRRIASYDDPTPDDYDLASPGDGEPRPGFEMWDET